MVNQRTISIAAAASLLLPILVAGTLRAADVEVHRIEQSFYPATAATLELDLTLGEIIVEGTDGREVEAEVQFFCSEATQVECAPRARSLRFAARSRKRVLSLAVRRTPRGRMRGIKTRLVVRAPRTMAVEIDLRSGNVTVSGMENNLEVDAAAGDVDVTYPAARIGRAKLDVGVGSANLWIGDQRIKGTGFPRKVRWSGTGAARLEVDAGTGDINVRLD